jgi:hypothetical protein
VTSVLDLLPLLTPVESILVKAEGYITCAVVTTTEPYDLKHAIKFFTLTKSFRAWPILEDQANHEDILQAQAQLLA